MECDQSLEICCITNKSVDIILTVHKIQWKVYINVCMIYEQII